jgi:ribosomal protein S18 acetylase RimI-like enzyme
VIKQIDPSDFSTAAEVIRKSFATVAKDFGITKENCPKHTSFITTDEIQKNSDWGWLMYGLYEGNQLIGYVSISKSREIDRVYEIHHIAVLPEYRHKSYGKQLLDFCKAKVKEMGGIKITLGMIEENTMLKNWYAANGFIHIGTKRFTHLPFMVGFMELEVL